MTLFTPELKPFKVLKTENIILLNGGMADVKFCIYFFRVINYSIQRFCSLLKQWLYMIQSSGNLLLMCY